MAEQSTVPKVAIGILAWVGVAILAIIAAANWDAFWGFFPVLGAVIIAWAVGEYVMRDVAADGDEQ